MRLVEHALFVQAMCTCASRSLKQRRCFPATCTPLKSRLVVEQRWCDHFIEHPDVDACRSQVDRPRQVDALRCRQLRILPRGLAAAAPQGLLHTRCAVGSEPHRKAFELVFHIVQAGRHRADTLLLVAAQHVAHALQHPAVSA